MEAQGALWIVVKTRQRWCPAARSNLGSVEREAYKDPVVSYWFSGEQTVNRALDQDFWTYWKKFLANGFNTRRKQS